MTPRTVIAEVIALLQSDPEPYDVSELYHLECVVRQRRLLERDRLIYQ